MCSPVIGLVLTGLSTLASAYSQKQAGDYNAAVLKESAKTDDALARDALNRGNQDQQAQDQKTRQIMARQSAAMAANNLDLQTGTPLDILGDTALFGEVDSQRIRLNAAREAYGFTQSAADKRAQAKFQKYQGKVGAFNTILGGAADIAGSSVLGKKSGSTGMARSGNTYSSSSGMNNASGFGYNPLAGGPR